MDKYYYMDVNNQNAGPISPSEFKTYGITADTLVWKDGMASKVKAGVLPQLKPYILPGKNNKKWILIPIGCGCLGLLICFIVAIILLFFSDCGGKAAYVPSKYENDIVEIVEEIEQDDDFSDSEDFLEYEDPIIEEENVEIHDVQPQIVEEWVPCQGCKGSGMCLTCNGTGMLYGDYCSVCCGRRVCILCLGRGGGYFKVERYFKSGRIRGSIDFVHRPCNLRILPYDSRKI